MSTNYHEQEVVSLKTASKQDRKRLHSFLRKRGFKPEDDFYELFRRGRCEPWQSSAILRVTVASSGAAVYETDEDIAEDRSTVWDELRCEYLLATLPRTYIDEYVREVVALSAEFGLRTFWQDEELEPASLSQRLNAVADELSREWGEPGSEPLRLLIEKQYGHS